MSSNQLNAEAEFETGRQISGTIRYYDTILVDRQTHSQGVLAVIKLIERHFPTKIASSYFFVAEKSRVHSEENNDPLDAEEIVRDCTETCTVGVMPFRVDRLSDFGLVWKKS